MMQSNQNLALALFKGKEGIEQKGVSVYEGVMYFSELVENFSIEENSDQMNEELKKQRDADKKRHKNFIEYEKGSDGIIFPNMTLFSNSLDVKREVTLSGKKLVEAVLEKSADRFICDGQGRTNFINWLLENKQEYADNTISFKLVVTHTENLSTPKAVEIIRQVFADYHINLTKPNQSISNYFDTSTPFSRLMNSLLDIELEAHSGERLAPFIALNGNIKRGQVWKYDQFLKMIRVFLGKTPAIFNKEFADKDISDVEALCSDFLQQVFKHIPLGILDTADFIKVHDENMFTKAIFCNALGYLGRSVVDDAINRSQPMDWSVICELNSAKLKKNDPYWRKNSITMMDEGALKIVKGTEKRIGALMCSELRIFPCLELMK